MQKLFSFFFLVVMVLSAGGCFNSRPGPGLEPVLPTPPFCRQSCEKKTREYKKKLKEWKEWRERKEQS